MRRYLVPYWPSQMKLQQSFSFFRENGLLQAYFDGIVVVLFLHSTKLTTELRSELWKCTLLFTSFCWQINHIYNQGQYRHCKLYYFLINGRISLYAQTNSNRAKQQQSEKSNCHKGRKKHSKCTVVSIISHQSFGRDSSYLSHKRRQGKERRQILFIVSLLTTKDLWLRHTWSRVEKWYSITGTRSYPRHDLSQVQVHTQIQTVQM